MAQALFYPVHLNTNGDHLIKTGLGAIGTITINTRGSGGNTLSLYQGIDATGTLIAVIDTTGALGSYLYDLLVSTGIFVVLAGGVCADVTVSYY